MRRMARQYILGKIDSGVYAGLTMTEMAEDVAFEFGHDEWLDDETHWIWDLVFDVCEEMEVIV